MEMCSDQIDALKENDAIVHEDDLGGYYAYRVVRCTKTTVVMACVNRPDLRDIRVNKNRFYGFYRADSPEGVEVIARMKFRVHRREIVDYLHYAANDTRNQQLIEELYAKLLEHDRAGMLRYKIKEK